MSESAEKPARRRRRRTASQLPGNHPYWLADAGGFATWEPLDLDAVLSREADGMFLGEVLDEVYEIDNSLSHRTMLFDGLSLAVYVTILDADEIDEVSFARLYPYIINVSFGEISDHYIFCPSLPVLFAVLSSFGPLIKQSTPFEDIASAAMEAMAERTAQEHSGEGEGEDGEGDDFDAALAGLESGGLDEQLVSHGRSSVFADEIVVYAIAASRYADAKRVCDRVEALLPFDAELGRAELALTRGKIAEEQRDFTAAEEYYRVGEEGLRRLAIDDDDLRIQAMLSLARIARLRDRLDDAEQFLLRAEQAVTEHEETQHHGEEGAECMIRLFWCMEAGDLYAARWRAQQDEGAYQQAVASLEQAIDLIGQHKQPVARHFADHARNLLRDLQRDHQR